MSTAWDAVREPVEEQLRAAERFAARFVGLTPELLGQHEQRTGCGDDAAEYVAELREVLRQWGALQRALAAVPAADLPAWVVRRAAVLREEYAECRLRLAEAFADWYFGDTIGAER